ncbi:MAG: hypothetical protein GF335_01900 [Candidatus Moranbacteria bacterium]|nr:hypothetical protein [Candidatus Moranbacteria bacterium]
MDKSRKQVENNLKKLLKDYSLEKKLSVQKVKDWIYNSSQDSPGDEMNKYQKKIFKYFQKVKNLDELEKIMNVFIECWNYFPHKSLDGKSPFEMVKKFQSKKK